MTSCRNVNGKLLLGRKRNLVTEQTYNVITPDNGVPIKAWTKGVPLEEAAQKQLLNVAQLPFIYKWVAAMPDVHWGSVRLSVA